jgi:hypothetical protein
MRRGHGTAGSRAGAHPQDRGAGGGGQRPALARALRGLLLSDSHDHSVAVGCAWRHDMLAARVSCGWVPALPAVAALRGEFGLR